MSSFFLVTLAQHELTNGKVIHLAAPTPKLLHAAEYVRFARLTDDDDDGDDNDDDDFLLEWFAWEMDACLHVRACVFPVYAATWTGR